MQQQCCTKTFERRFFLLHPFFYFICYMKTATIKELKEELTHRSREELVEYCLRLGKFKKENKELLTYLLFNAGDEPGFIASVKNGMDELFTQVNTSNIYFAKKSIRKIVRTADRFIRYCDTASVEAELRIFLCEKIKALNMDFSKSQVMQNIYDGQLKKINKVIASMHEDLQYDFSRQLKRL